MIIEWEVMAEGAEQLNEKIFTSSIQWEIFQIDSISWLEQEESGKKLSS